MNGLMETQCRDYREIFILQGDEKESGYAGGVFWALARAVIEKKGIVVGAAYMDDFSVRHIDVDNMEHLRTIAGVKYAESIVSEELYERIKQKLQDKVPVLFAGTLCQMESIYRFLDKEYETFYTAAVKCSGVIRAEIWKDYIDEIQSNGSVISEIHCPYRGRFGISQNKLLIKFRHGTAYFRDEKEDKLLRLKNAGLIYREECRQCSRRPEYSKTDIFLEKYYDSSQRDALQETGLTQVSVFSKKGEKLLTSSRDRLKCMRQYKIHKSNIPSRHHKSKLYHYFWKYYEEYGFSFASNLVISKMESFCIERVKYRFWERYALLDAAGISIEKILSGWGIEKVILYGYGKIGKVLTDKLKNSESIFAVISSEVSKENKIIDCRWRKTKEEIRVSDLPVLVMPGYFVPDIMDELNEYGVCRKRILPLNMLIDLEYDSKIRQGHTHTVWNKEKQGIGDIYLITGAQFANKGAQSMLFTAVSELRRKNPDCDIYYLPIDSPENYSESDLKKYKFHILLEKYGIYSQLYDVLPQLKAIVDISGYALASKWNCGHFIHILLLAKHKDIPIYYMPQSFGPLDFTKDWEKRIRGALAHASVIFAREEEGYNMLTQKYQLKNCRMSKDLVLQNRGITIENVYTEALNTDSYHLKTHGNIAIVPNMRNYEAGNRSKLLELYKVIITELLKKGKMIYIVPHSDDAQACREIYDMFREDKHVFLYEKCLDCLEFSVLAEEFQYMIASRYHAVIHAYKKGVPCIVIGWAEKYKELLHLFGQERYTFDVRSKIDKEEIIAAVCHMEASWLQEKKKIQERLPVIQSENCFDVIK